MRLNQSEWRAERVSKLAAFAKETGLFSKIRLCVVLFAIYLLSGCFAMTEQYTTLDEVAAPYINIFGQPEDIYQYTSGSYSSQDWWWWTKGHEVTFAKDNDIYGWHVDSEYDFPPIP